MTIPRLQKIEADILNLTSLRNELLKEIDEKTIKAKTITEQIRKLINEKVRLMNTK